MPKAPIRAKPCPIPNKRSLTKNKKLALSNIHNARLSRLISIMTKPIFRHFFAATALARYCTTADTSRIQVMAVPLTKGPCHGKISCTKEGESEANKLKAAKALNAVNPMIIIQHDIEPQDAVIWGRY